MSEWIGTITLTRDDLENIAELAQLAASQRYDEGAQTYAPQWYWKAAPAKTLDTWTLAESIRKGDMEAIRALAKEHLTEARAKVADTP